MTCDVFVAGLGVMGSAAARALAIAGLRVVGCDQLHPPHERGSSHGESRIIRAAYFEDPVYVPLAQRAFASWRELERETGRSLLRITGGLNIGPAEGMLVRGALESARLHAIAHELLDASELEKRYRGLRVGTGEVGVYEPEAGVLDPEECVAAQLDSARSAGAELHLGDALIGWQHHRDGFLIETASGRFEAKTLVLALGAWLPQFRPQLPLRVTRQPVFWFEPLVRGEYEAAVLPHYLIEFEPGRVFYGFPDLGSGLKCAIHHEGEVTTSGTVDRGQRKADLELVLGLVARYLPGALGPLRRTSVCLYTNTPDQHFLIDRDPAQPGVFLLSPCSGHGFKFAPAIADLVVQRLMGEGAAHETFSIGRLSS